VRVSPEKLAALLHAMNSPVRLRMLTALDEGPLLKSKLYRRVGVPHAVGRVHLELLVKIGAVREDGDRVEVARTGWRELIAELEDLARRNGF
jgi:DNA-binding transcriptional ArsR family regulator